MNRRRIIIIANPKAGAFLKKTTVEDFAGLLRAGAAEVRVHWIDASPLPLPDAGGDDDLLWVVAGGDGTLHRVVNHLRDGGRDVALGFLPTGTANVFALEARLPKDPEALAALFLAAPPTPYMLGRSLLTGMDGRIGEKRFLLMGGIGWDAQVTAAVPEGVKRLHGPSAYLVAGLRLLVGGAGAPLSIWADGVEMVGEAVVVANSPFYAGPYSLAPKADPRRPTFSLAVVKTIGPAAMARLLRCARYWKADTSGNTRYLEASAVEITTSGAPVQLDGDLAGVTPARFIKDGGAVPIIMNRRRRLRMIDGKSR